MIRTERGWPGHFISAKQCNFRRNTLLEQGKTRIVISTVGACNKIDGYPRRQGPFDTIGPNRYYETMAFRAKKEGIYWEIDISEKIEFDSPWSLSYISQVSNHDANIMHETVVEEITRNITGEL
jgi:hypothetical protein